MDSANLDNLDVSWLENHKRMLNIHENYQREYMDTIRICYVYINEKSEIDKVISEREHLLLIGKYKGLPKERVLQIVQNKKIINNVDKYTLDSILLYNVSIEPENIQKYVNSENILSDPFLKIYPIVHEIEIPPSIFIFHEINCIYFIFKQIDANHLKSILKKGGIESESSMRNGKKTKKVRIQNNITKKMHR
jgi:hypothetical protein